MASHVPIKSHLVFDGRMVSQEARKLGWLVRVLAKGARAPLERAIGRVWETAPREMSTARGPRK